MIYFIIERISSYNRSINKHVSYKYFSLSVSNVSSWCFCDVAVSCKLITRVPGGFLELIRRAGNLRLLVELLLCSSFVYTHDHPILLQIQLCSNWGYYIGGFCSIVIYCPTIYHRPLLIHHSCLSECSSSLVESWFLSVVYIIWVTSQWFRVTQHQTTVSWTYSKPPSWKYSVHAPPYSKSHYCLPMLYFSSEVYYVAPPDLKIQPNEMQMIKVD